MPRAGTILRVDLTEGKIEKEPTSKYVQDWLGGDGIGSMILATEVPPETKGLDPENMLTFNTGPLTGTLRGARMGVMYKSPMLIHSIQAVSNMGGQFPAELKFAGYDNLIIKGKAEKPVYLFINDDKVEIRDAGHLWGLDTYQTQEQIKSELNDPDVQVACIGVAGENQVAYAIILHDINFKAGRGGGGAVMGSKNLKAIAVRGTKGLKVADPAKWLEVWNAWFPGTFPNKLDPNHWTKKSMLWHGDIEDTLDIYCWGGDYGNLVCPEPPPEQKLELFADKYFVGNLGCAFCPEQCQPRVVVPGVGSGASLCGVPGEFQTRWKIYDSMHWWRSALMANLLGVDTHGTSGIIGWLMRLREEGMISPEDMDGIDLQWGNGEAARAMLEKIARKDGFGQVLADGILPAAKKIGKGSGSFARQTKGMEILNYFLWPGGQLGMALGLSGAGVYADPAAIENAAEIIEGILKLHPEPGMTEELIPTVVEAMRSAKAEHMCGDADAWRLFEDDGETPRGTNKAKMVLAFSRQTRLADMCGVCDQSTGAGPRYLTSLRDLWQEMADFLTADLGVEYTTEMLQEQVQRVRMLERGYEYLCGLRREDEVMPDDVYQPTKTRKWGTRIFMTPEIMEKMKNDYYTEEGCDPVTGVPARETLEKLGLQDMAERLAKIDLSPRPVPTQVSSMEAPAKLKVKAKHAKSKR